MSTHHDCGHGRAFWQNCHECRRYLPPGPPSLSPLQQLDNWVKADRGRYVFEFTISNDYDDTCWSLTVGNTDVAPEEDWFKEEGTARDRDLAEVYGVEMQLFDAPDKLAPNIVIANKHERLGPEDLIIKVLARAEELGL